jgi:hypothetical protein
LIYQRDYAFTVGYGPGKCGAVGCVVCACTTILNDLQITVALTPRAFNEKAIEAGAFTHDKEVRNDSLKSGVALRAFGALAEERQFQNISAHCARIIDGGGRALLRVAFDRDTPKGHHTIAVVKRTEGGFICHDSAAGLVFVDDTCTGAALWRGVSKSYYPVSIRGVFRKER